MKKITLNLICLLLLITGINNANAQIVLPPEFKCVNGKMTNGTISFNSHYFDDDWKNKTAPRLAKILNNNSELCCGKYLATKDGLIWATGTYDTEGEGAGDFFYKVFSPFKNEWVCVSSRFNDKDFKNWSAWLLRSVRSVSGNLQIANSKNKLCK